MGAMLKPLLIWILSSAIAKVLLALGIAFTTYQGLDLLLEQALGQIDPLIGALPAAVSDILAKFGLFKVISIISSTMISIASVKMMKTFVGMQ